MCALGIVLNTIILLLSIFTVFPDVAANEDIKTIFCVTIIVLQLLSIMVGSKYQGTVEKEKINSEIKSISSKKELINKVVPYKKDSVQGAREEMRQGLTALTTVFIICCIFWAFMTGEFRKFIVVVCVVTIAFIYADYLSHNSYYTKKYDEKLLTDKKDTPNSIRGLARIYRHEYKELKFKRFFNKKNTSSYQNTLTQVKKRRTIKNHRTIRNRRTIKPCRTSVFGLFCLAKLTQ